MKSPWHQRRLIEILLLMVIGMLFTASPLEASEPSKDYWFNETITIGDVDLPAGVIIHASDPETQPRGNMIIENQTQTLLFVLSLGYKDVLVMLTPDPNWETRVNGAHEVASYLISPGRPAVLEMEAFTDLDQDLEDKNVLSFDPPPENVAIPAEQSSELLFVYDGQVILLPFTVSYEINSKFANAIQANHPQTADDDVGTAVTQQVEIAPEPGMSNYPLFIGLLGISGILIIGWLVWRGMFRSKK